jgi:hypothetical protein
MLAMTSRTSRLLAKPLPPVPPDESYDTGMSTHELPWSVTEPVARNL